MRDDIERVILTEKQIQTRVSALAEEIVQTYADSPGGLTIVCILSGSIIFLADLIRCMPMKMRLGLLTISSYPGRSRESCGAVLTAAATGEVRGAEVLVVDDILDTGGTLRLVQRELGEAGVRSLRTAVLLRKRWKAPSDVAVEFVGFDVEDEFVVGYGLDFNGLYRNLPYIAVLKASVYEDGAG